MLTSRDEQSKKNQLTAWSTGIAVVSFFYLQFGSKKIIFNVQLKRDSIRQSKGMKHRILPLVVEAREGVEHWVLSREKMCERFIQRNSGAEMPAWMHSIEGAFVFGQRGVLTLRGINHITQRVWTAAGFEGALGPHALRHTFAKSALDPKAYGLARDALPLPALQQAMGHSRIDTTSVYTKFSNGEIGLFLEQK
jgi:site-specific recombinase XerD